MGLTLVEGGQSAVPSLVATKPDERRSRREQNWVCSRC